MIGRIEAYLYGSGVAGVRAGTSDLTIVEATGPVTQTVTLSLPGLLESGALSALTQWQTALNASPLNNTYSLSWTSATQTVRIQRATGASTFRPTLGGDLRAVWGWKNNPAGYATLFDGDTPSLARFEDVRVRLLGIRDATRVDLQEYRHGRAEALTYGTHDVADLTLLLPIASARRLLRSYCAAGRVRVWQSTAVGSAFGEYTSTGYLDGFVMRAEARMVGPWEQWGEVALKLALPRS